MTIHGHPNPRHRSRRDRLPALVGVRGSRRVSMRAGLMRGGGVVDTGASVGADHAE